MNQAYIEEVVGEGNDDKTLDVRKERGADLAEYV